MWIISVAHAMQLRHIDILREMPIEKDIIYIKLAKASLAIEGNAKHNTDGDEIYQGTESLIKANARLLVKSFRNKVSFIPCNRAIGILFDVKQPFIAHYIQPKSRGNQNPSTVLDDGIIFFLHCLNPLRIWRAWAIVQGSGDSW